MSIAPTLLHKKLVWASRSDELRNGKRVNDDVKKL